MQNNRSYIFTNYVADRRSSYSSYVLGIQYNTLRLKYTTLIIWDCFLIWDDTVYEASYLSRYPQTYSRMKSIGLIKLSNK